MPSATNGPHWAWDAYCRNNNSPNIGEFPQIAMEMVYFLIINLLSTYKENIGRPSQTTFKAVPSTEHQIMKFSTEHGIKSNQQASREFYLDSLRTKLQWKSLHVDLLNVQKVYTPKRRHQLKRWNRLPPKKAKFDACCLHSHNNSSNSCIL